MKVVKEAIYDKLYATAAIVTAVGTNIYQGLAPQTATYPLITITHIGGGTTTETPTDAVDELYLVSAISDISAAEADTIVDLIHTALHKVTLSVSGWTNIWTAVGNHLEVVELPSSRGVPLWQAGRYIRIRLEK